MQPFFIIFSHSRIPDQEPEEIVRPRNTARFPSIHLEQHIAHDLTALSHRVALARQSAETLLSFETCANSVVSKEIGTFDIVLSEATLEHQKDPKLFLTSCCNLTKDGGSYLVTTPNSVKLLQRFRFLFGRSPNWNIEDFFECGESFTGHWREYTMKELVYMCTKTGFSVEETYNVNVIASFRNLSFSRKNFNALVVRISGLFPGTREMNYLLCKKLMCNR